MGRGAVPPPRIPLPVTSVHLDHLFSRPLPRGAGSVRSTSGFDILCTYNPRSGGGRVYGEVYYEQLGPEIRGDPRGSRISPSWGWVVGSALPQEVQCPSPWCTLIISLAELCRVVRGAYAFLRTWDIQRIRGGVEP